MKNKTKLLTILTLMTILAGCSANAGSSATVSQEVTQNAVVEEASAPAATTPAAATPETVPPSGKGTELTEAEAKKIALNQVPGATESDIRGFEIDYDDGKLEYEGSIYYNEMEYEFEIDGYSGAIRSWEVESIYD